MKFGTSKLMLIIVVMVLPYIYWATRPGTSHILARPYQKAFLGITYASKENNDTKLKWPEDTQVMAYDDGITIYTLIEGGRFFSGTWPPMTEISTENSEIDRIEVNERPFSYLKYKFPAGTRIYIKKDDNEVLIRVLEEYTFKGENLTPNSIIIFDHVKGDVVGIKRAS